MLLSRPFATASSQGAALPAATVATAVGHASVWQPENERASKLAGGGPRLSDSCNTGQSTARHAHTHGTRQNGANETKHHPLLQEHSRPDERRAELEKAPARLSASPAPALGRASHELPWSFVPAAVAPILTRAGVRLLRQEPPPLAHLKKGQPSAVLPSLHTHHGCPARLLCHKTPCDHHPLNSRYRGRQLHTHQPQWIPICAPSSTCC